MAEEAKTKGGWVAKWREKRRVRGERRRRVAADKVTQGVRAGKGEASRHGGPMM
jgi:hypothetical protein